MNKVVIAGAADKRGLVYPLLRALSINGHVCLITDDVAYKRLLPDHSNLGMIGNTEIAITTNTIDDAYIDEICSNRPCDTVLIVTTSDVVDGATHVINCSYEDTSLRGLPTLNVRSKKTTDVLISFNSIVAKDLNNVALLDCVEYIYTVESRKELIRMTNTKFNKNISHIASIALGMTSNQLLNLLNRKDNWNSGRK